MASETAPSVGSGSDSTLSSVDVDALYNQYQKSQSQTRQNTDDTYKEYTKQQSIAAGNALKADPDNKEKFDSYRNAVKSYYEAHGGIGDEFVPDWETPKRLVEGGKKFFQGIGENVGKVFAGESATQSALGAGGGALASLSDIAVMPFEAGSWFKEKNLARRGSYEEAATVAAERLRDKSSINRATEKYLQPESEEGKAAFEVVRPIAGMAAPVAAARMLRGAAPVAEAAEAAQAAKTAGFAEQVGSTIGGTAGMAGGFVKGGIPGAALGAKTGAETGGRIGKFVGEVAEGAGTAATQYGRSALEGGAVGGLLVGAAEPAGTPMAEGVIPGAAFGVATQYGVGKAKQIAEAYREGRGPVEGAQPKQGPQNLFKDFKPEEGGVVDMGQNRVAFEAGPGVGRQSQAFKETKRAGFHEGVIKSHETMQSNPTHGKGDDVMRYGYDPETQTLQVVMGKQTKGDVVPIDRYIYQEVSPEVAREFMNSPSKSDFMNTVAGRGGDGIRLTRVRITDSQINGIVDALNQGIIDFHSEWGFQRGTQTPRQNSFVKPQRETAQEPDQVFTDKEKADLQKEGWASRFVSSLFKKAGKVTGETVRGAKSALSALEEGEPASVTKEGVLSSSEWEKMGGRPARRPTVSAEEQQPEPGMSAPVQTQKALPSGETPEPAPTKESVTTPKLLNEPESVTQRRKDVEEAIAEEERQKAEEERLRQSPQGAQALKRQLSIQEEGLTPSLRTPVEEPDVSKQGTETFNNRRNRILDEFKRDGIPINRDTLDAANELARIAQRHYGDLKRAIYDEYAPQKTQLKAPLKSFEELPGGTAEKVQETRVEAPEQAPEATPAPEAEVPAKATETPVKPTGEEPPPEAAPEPAKPTPTPPAPAATPKALEKAPEPKPKGKKKVLATLENTESGVVAKPSPKEDQRISQLATKKQLEEQKIYISNAVGELLEKAPENPKFEKIKDQDDFAKAADKYAFHSNLKGVYNRRLAEDAKRIMDSMISDAEKVTIEVPGDGTFRVPNSKRYLEAFDEMIAKKFGKDLKMTKPSGRQLPKLEPEEIEAMRVIEENPPKEGPLSSAEPVKRKALETLSEPQTATPSKELKLSDYEKAISDLDDLRVQDVKKSSVKMKAEALVRKGVLTEKELASLDSMFKDRDMGVEDVVGELNSILNIKAELAKPKKRKT